ncbi:hypothetical protein GO491_11735 [Flavobacteriaceae bacterium Ap0902]|nr:hypothetical protein [Flavobacteriaceae bacterium Ap0902]
MAKKEDNLLKGHPPTQFPHNDPTKGGRKPSIRKQLEDLLGSDGNLTMPASQVVKINNDGSVVLKVPTQMQMAMKLSSWAMSKKGNDSLKAIQMIMEQIDGKPKQTIDNQITEATVNPYKDLPKEALEEMDSILNKHLKDE